MNQVLSDKKAEVNKNDRVNQEARFFIERRRRKRCPECQFFLAFVLILLSSLAVSFLLNIFPSLINKGDFQIIAANSFESNNNIVIDADIKMDFPYEVVEAL